MEVWQLAREFVKLIYQTTKEFPQEEIFGISSQMRRAVLSIMLNISEGSNRKSDIEFIRFLRIAYTSLEEVIAASYAALDQNYLNKEKFEIIYNDGGVLSRKINALINSIK